MKTVEVTFLILLATTLSIIADIFLKKSHLENYSFLAAGILFYALSAFPVAAVFNRTDFGTVFLIWQTLMVITALALGSWMFKESFTVYKALALFFAMIALYFSYK